MSCGEPSQVAIEFRVSGINLSDEPIDAEKYMEENRRAREQARRMTEARALEYAGDLPGAIALYWQLIDAGIVYPLPYKRLAIIYAKSKQFADEERVVRTALANIPCDGPNNWFVLRLAKILSKRRRAE